MTKKEMIGLWEKYCPFVDVAKDYIANWAQETPVEYCEYYDSGAIKFEGHGVPDRESQSQKGNPKFIRYGEGKSYYEDGTIKEEGFFQLAGLLFGRSYYPSGALKFEGKYNDKQHGHGTYYGPSYPVYGRFYSEKGKLKYEGEFKIIHQGNVGYPKVIYPEGFPSLT